MYLTLCSTPPLMALHRSSVDVSGCIFPRYTVRFMPPAPPAPFIPIAIFMLMLIRSGAKGVNGEGV